MALKQHHNSDHIHQPRRSSRDCASDYLTMAGDHHHHLRPPTPDRLSRSSFSSIRENESTLTQDFTHSKVSSYLNNEEAVDDTEHSHAAVSSPPRNLKMIQTQFRPPVTHPHSKLLGFYTPAENFQGWKQIQVRGKLASKSFGDLQILNNVWTAPLKSKSPKSGLSRPGGSPLERLPPEILSKQQSLLLHSTWSAQELSNTKPSFNNRSSRHRRASERNREAQY